MKYKICLMMSCLLLLVACSSSGASSGSGGSGDSGDSNLGVSSAQLKALSQLKNLKAKNKSQNSPSSLNLFNQLESPFQTSGHGTTCKKYEYASDFTEAPTETAIACSQTMDFSSIIAKTGDSTIESFNTDEIIISKRGTKHMGFYESSDSHQQNCTTLTGTSYCKAIFITDSNFYSNGYNSGFGSLHIDNNNSTSLFFTSYFWDSPTENPVNVDLSTINKPIIPTPDIYINMGTKDNPCKTVGAGPDEYCVWYLAVQDEGSKQYVKFIGQFEMSDSYPKDSIPNDMVMDLFVIPSQNEFENLDATKKDVYFRETIMKKCAASPTGDNDEKFYKYKVGYLVMSMTGGNYSAKTLGSDWSSGESGGVDFTGSETIAVSSDTVDDGTDCKRMTSN